MERDVRCIWVEGLQVDAYSHTGKLVRFDGWRDREREETGPSPGELLPMSLGACTAMDVAFIAEKMRLDLGGLEVEVHGETTDEHPKYYTEMKVVFHFTGENLDEEKLKHAIALSRDKYCIVGNSLRESITSSYYYTLNGGDMKEVPENLSE